MTSPLAHSTSDTARLMSGALGFQVGWQEPVYIPNPAAGADWKYTVGGRYFERLISAHWDFGASAAAGTRVLDLSLLDQNGNTIITVPAAGHVATGTSIAINLMVGMQVLSSNAALETWGGIPDLLIPPGWTWEASTAFIDVADTETGIVLLVQRFPSDAVSTVVGS
jgi:hypothetical protein